jgi:hypothetical protein
MNAAPARSKSGGRRRRTSRFNRVPGEDVIIVSHQSTTSDQTRFSASPNARWIRGLVISGVTIAAIIAVALLGKIPQSVAYHNFADQRRILGIPNFINVVSNVPFLLGGIWGVLFVIRSRPADSRSFVHRFERWPYLIFFFGVTLTSFGSAYYHLAPSTERLMWDRFPISIAFMSLLAAVIGERINAKAGVVLLAPLLAVGVGSVVSWHLSEQNGDGDLRLYVLVQFYSLLAVVLIAAMFSSRYSRSKELVVALFCYALAKALELLDLQIFSIGRVVSGHTLKHLTAAVSACLIIHMLEHRVPRPNKLSVGQPANV